MPLYMVRFQVSSCSKGSRMLTIRALHLSRTVCGNSLVWLSRSHEAATRAPFVYTVHPHDMQLPFTAASLAPCTEFPFPTQEDEGGQGRAHPSPGGRSLELVHIMPWTSCGQTPPTSMGSWETWSSAEGPQEVRTGNKGPGCFTEVPGFRAKSAAEIGKGGQGRGGALAVQD